MPLIGLVHSGDGEFIKCGLDPAEWGPFAPLMPLPIVADIVQRHQADTWHSGPRITVTSGLGCPRELVMWRFMDVHADPLKMWSMTAGSWLHEHLARLHTNGGKWLTEHTHPQECTFEGELYGLHVGCRVDLRRDDFSAVWDWKTSLSGKSKWVKVVEGRAVCEPEYAAQLNLCRLLMEQTTGRDLSGMEMAAWVVSSGLVKMYADVMSEAQVGLVKPGRGLNSVAELFSDVARAFNKVSGGADPATVAAGMPLYGQDMWRNKQGGNKCLAYCALKYSCDTLNGGL